MKEIIGKTLAVCVYEIGLKMLRYLQITMDCNALLTENVIDLGVITKSKGKVDNIDNGNADDWIGRDPKTEYHYVWIKNISRLLFENNLHKCQKFRCRNCFRLCSSSYVYNTHIKHCLEVSDGQKIILPTKGKSDIIEFNKFGSKLAYPFVIMFDLESVLRNPDESYEILNEHKNVSYASKECIANDDIDANIPLEIR